MNQASSTLSENHPFLSTEKDIQDICLNMLKQYGLNYFNFLRVYDDGHGVIVSSNHQIINYLFNNQVPLAAPIQSELIKENFNYFVLPVGSYQQVVHDLKMFFDLSYFFDLVERSVGYIDLYCFGASADNPSIINFYLNNLSLFENFKSYFKKKAQCLLKKVLAHKILLPYQMLPPYKGLSHSEKDKSIITKLTKQQLKCLDLLARGYTAKQMSTDMGLSPRTVESYIAEIRNRLGYHRKSDIINLIMPHRVVGD